MTSGNKSAVVGTEQGATPDVFAAGYEDTAGNRIGRDENVVAWVTLSNFRRTVYL